MKFEKFFRTPILKNVCERLLPLLKNILWPYITMKKWSHASTCKTFIGWIYFCSVRTLKTLRNILPGLGLHYLKQVHYRGVFRTLSSISKMEHFEKIINGIQSLTIFQKCSIKVQNF